eukprot:754279-Rhodomonas_salina.2
MQDRAAGGADGGGVSVSLQQQEHVRLVQTPALHHQRRLPVLVLLLEVVDGHVAQLALLERQHHPQLCVSPLPRGLQRLLPHLSLRATSTKLCSCSSSHDTARSAMYCRTLVVASFE